LLLIRNLRAMVILALLNCVLDTILATVSYRVHLLLFRRCRRGCRCCSRCWCSTLRPIAWEELIRLLFALCVCWVRRFSGRSSDASKQGLKSHLTSYGFLVNQLNWRWQTKPQRLREKMLKKARNNTSTNERKTGLVRENKAKTHKMTPVYLKNCS